MISVPTADRVNDYQHYALDAVKSCSQYEDMGAQVTVYQKGSQELEQGGVKEEEEVRDNNI